MQTNINPHAGSDVSREALYIEDYRPASVHSLPEETRAAFAEFCRGDNLIGTEQELRDWICDHTTRCCMTNNIYPTELCVRLSDDEWCLAELEDEAEAEINDSAGYSNDDLPNWI